MKSQTHWGQLPKELLQTRAIKKQRLIKLSCALFLAASACLLLARYSEEVLQSLGLPAGSATRWLSSLLGYAGAAVFGMLTLQTLLPSAEREPSWQQSLDATQRKLLGLAPLPAVAKVAPQPGTRLPGSPITPLGPPLKGGKAAAITVAPAAEAGAAQQAVPSTGKSGGRPSPFPSRQVTTPVQLQQLLGEFEAETQAAAAAAAAAAPAEGGYSPYGYGGAPYGSPAGSAGPAEARRLTTAMGPAAGLPIGAAAPTYRPSAVPKGAAALPHRPDGRVQASSEEAVKAVLRQLGTSERHLEVCTERLREWVAGEVLQPLVQAVGGAHQQVVEAAARLGWTGLQLSPLHEAMSGTVSAAGASGGGPLALVALSSKALSVSQADDEVLIKQMQDHLLGRVHALPPSQAPPADVVACLNALGRYQRLAALLRGEYPAGLLPPSPPGYIADRIRELAEGPCLKAFTWNSGGSYNGKPWSGEAPTDSALLLYLFAAFLAAPYWDFPKDDVTELGPAGPLYLGKLPTRVADEYFAILSYRPPQNQQGTGIVGLLLGSQQPHFSLLLRGETVLTLTEQFGVMHAIILLVLHCKQHADGFLGPRSLHFLRLQQVVRTVPDFKYLLGGRLFGMW